MENKKTIQPLEDVEHFLETQKTKKEHPATTLDYFKEKIVNLSNFAFGRYIWYITNRKHYSFEEVGGDSVALFGYTNQEIKNAGPIKMMNYVEDQAKHLAFLQYFWKFILEQLPEERKNFKASIYLRARSKEGTYKPMQMQFIDWIIEQNEVLNVFVSVTDLSHFTDNVEPKLTILDVANNEVSVFVSENPKEENPAKIDTPKLTKRQIEILSLLAKGLSSKMIGQMLYISVNTVNNHRQHLLKLTHTPNVSRLISFAFEHGLVNNQQ